MSKLEMQHTVQDGQLKGRCWEDSPQQHRPPRASHAVVMNKHFSFEISTQQ